MQAAVKGESVGEGVPCPICGATGGLKYTSCRVDRGSLWRESGCIEARCTPVPLCRCDGCKRRIRVLPLEIPPFKSYTLAVIETGCSVYSDPDLPHFSLKKTVEGMGHGHPHPSALHGWLGGLGERVLGRLDRTGGYLPVSALIAETGKHFETELFDQWRQPRAVAHGKYKSIKRREQLEACTRLFAVAQRLSRRNAHPFGEWERWLQCRFHVAAWVFPARFCRTDFQQHGPRGPSVQYAPCSTGPKRPVRERNHGARSPP